MIALTAKPTRVTLVSGLLLVILLLLVLAVVIAQARLGSTPMLHHLSIASNATTGGPGWP